MAPLERRWIWILACIGFLSRLALAFRSEWQIASRPYLDDSFYLISCARHLALGHGFTVDGVHPTNGVQPLICLLYAPGFWLPGDPSVGLRFTFAVGALLQTTSTILFGFLLARLRKNSDKMPAPRVSISAPIAGAFLWTIIAPLADQNGSGLETGLVSLLLLCTLFYYQTIIERGWNFSRSVWLGCLLGLMVLARIDSALFILAMGLIEWRRLRAQSLGYIALSAALAVIISLPWWIYGYSTFGSLMPMSGAAESLGHPIGENLLQSLTALFDMMTIFFNHIYFAWPPWFEVVSFFVLAIAWMFIVVRTKAVTYLKERFDLRALAPLAVFSVLAFVFYNFFFSAPHFLVRYLQPVRILSLILVAAMFPLLLRAASDWSSRLGKFAVCAFLVAAISFSGYRYVNNFTAPPKSDFYRVGLWAREHSGRVGLDQSGQAGFFAPKVVNLDGKVNPDALAAQKSGKIGEYIAREKIEYLADWKALVEPLVSDAAKYGANYKLFDSVGYVLIYKREPGLR